MKAHGGFGARDRKTGAGRCERAGRRRLSPVLAADVDGRSLVVVLALLVELRRLRELLEGRRWDQRR